MIRIGSRKYFPCFCKYGGNCSFDHPPGLVYGDISFDDDEDECPITNSSITYVAAESTSSTTSDDAASGQWYYSRDDIAKIEAGFKNVKPSRAIPAEYIEKINAVDEYDVDAVLYGKEWGVAVAIGALPCPRIPMFREIDPIFYMLCFTGFEKSEWNDVIWFSGEFALPYAKPWAPVITHLIVKTTDHDNTTPSKRTIKYLLALSNRIPIVSSAWITDSLKGKKLLNLEQYIIDDYTVGARRDEKKAIQYQSPNQTPLAGINFFIADSVEELIWLDEFEHLIKRCGGQIIYVKDEFKAECANGNCLALCRPDFYKMFNAPVVDLAYVMMCIKRNKLVPDFCNYILCSRTLFERDLTLA